MKRNLRLINNILDFINKWLEPQSHKDTKTHKKNFVLPFCLRVFVVQFYLFVFSAILFPTFLSAQEKKLVNDEYPQWSLRTNPGTVIELDAGVMLGVNYRWSEKYSASFEPTWIFYDLARSDNNKIYPSGLRIRTDLRKHLRGKFLGMKPYLGIELHFKKTSTKLLEQFGMNCQNGSCAFYQNAVYKELKREFGGFIKWGLLSRLSKNERWFLEFYGGLGVKHMKFSERDIPDGASFLSPPERFFPERLFIGIDRNSFYHPMLPGGIKLMFVLE